MDPVKLDFQNSVLHLASELEAFFLNWGFAAKGFKTEKSAFIYWLKGAWLSIHKNSSPRALQVAWDAEDCGWVLEFAQRYCHARNHGFEPAAARKRAWRLWECRRMR